MTAKLWSCDGYWKPTVWHDKKQPFSDMIVCDGELDGVDDAVDERIFYYTDEVLPVIGDHGDFVITNAEEIE